MEIYEQGVYDILNEFDHIDINDAVVSIIIFVK